MTVRFPIASCGLQLDDETVKVAVSIGLGLAICVPSVPNLIFIFRLIHHLHLVSLYKTSMARNGLIFSALPLRNSLAQTLTYSVPLTVDRRAGSRLTHEIHSFVCKRAPGRIARYHTFTFKFNYCTKNHGLYGSTSCYISHWP